VCVATGIDFDMSISLDIEIRQQQSCIQFKLRTNEMIQDANLAFSPNQSVLNIRTSAQLLHACSATDASPAYIRRLRRSTLPRPVHESSSWTSKEVYEMSHNPAPRLSVAAG